MTEIELAAPSSNGKRPKADRERGSSFDYHSDFYGGTDGKTVYDLTEFTARGMENMLRESGNAAKLEAVLTLPLLSSPPKIVPAKGDKGEAEWATEALLTPANHGGMSTPLHQVVAQAAAAVVYRKAYFEKVYTAREVAGKTALVYDKIAWRPTSTCEAAWDGQTGAFRGFRQAVAPFTPKQAPTKDGYVTIEAPYAFVYTHGVRRHPMKGHSELNVAYWAWETSQKVLWLWMRYLERHALPLVTVKSADETAGKAAGKEIARLKASGVIYFPDGVDADILDTTGGVEVAKQYQDCLRWLESKATESVLAGFTDLASQASTGHGSLALSSDASSFFLQSREADARELSEQLTNFLLADLVKLNLGRDAVCPTIEIGPLVRADTNAAFTMLSSLAMAPQIRVPDEFVDELLVLVAKRLEIDPDAMRRAAKRARVEAERKAQSEQAAQVAGIAAQVSVAEAAAKGKPNDDLPSPRQLPRPPGAVQAGPKPVGG